MFIALLIIHDITKEGQFYPIYFCIRAQMYSFLVVFFYFLENGGSIAELYSTFPPPISIFRKLLD